MPGGGSCGVFGDGEGRLLPFAGVEVLPGRLEQWARGVAKLQPHIRVELA